jgi:hypothetical protein
MLWFAVIVAQDFVHYVLKHSMVVLMTARDESTSFKIFSTLNGRGVDLAVIDKLKPELLQVIATCQAICLHAPRQRCTGFVWPSLWG